VAEASRLRVAIVGETIVDEWVDVTLSNLSTQSRCVAGFEIGRVRQIGGAGIIARHLANFASAVDCFTNGSTGNVAPRLHVTRLCEGELVETRFVDQETGRPVFKSRRRTLPDAPADGLPDFEAYDLVLVADFGHGLLDADAVNARIARRQDAFVAAMAQVNSSNYGYHLPVKYVGADYYSLNRTEAELCLHARGLPLDALTEQLASLLRCDAVSVTDGSHGAMVRKNGERFALPSLSVSTVDTIGCGDAYFALSSLAACLDLPVPIVALVGSIGAAAMSQRRCNEAPVSEQEFLTIGKIVV
jgi:bifunctional ADP-heptose synthase (sugar kinase/adenylyltransferase)